MRISIDTMLKRLVFTMVVTILFMGVGWTMPVMYTSYAPDNHFVEVHSFETQNVTAGETSHQVCLDRTVRRGGTAQTYVELVEVKNDSVTGSPTYSWEREGYFERGHKAVNMTFPLPENLSEGEYVYIASATFTFSSGRVERTFTARSETFYVENDSTAGSNWDC